MVDERAASTSTERQARSGGGSASPGELPSEGAELPLAEEYETKQDLPEEKAAGKEPPFGQCKYTT